MARWRVTNSRRFSQADLARLGADGVRLACREMHVEMARRGLGPNDYLLEGVAAADGGHEVRAIEPDERVIEFDDRGIV